MSAFALTAGFVATAADGRITSGSRDHAFASVSTDSRTIEPGALFVALRGDHFDGHAFLQDAIARGAAGVVTEVAPSRPGQATVIVVSDTLRALQALGRAVRRESGAVVIAVTGSAGKTTTKEVTADLLAARYRVFRTRGNLNNHIGLPLSLIELRHGPEIAVVELGMNHAGEIAALVAIAEPDARVWINVGDAHIGHLGAREDIARAKAEILSGSSDSTLLVVNADDPLVMTHVAGFPGRVRTFGTVNPADVHARVVIDRGFEGTTAEAETPVGSLHLTVPLAGRAQLSNVLAAVTVALEFGIDSASIESRVAALAPVARRGAIAHLARGVRVVDDSYNASPAAVQAMLLTLAATPNAGRRIAVIGEMRELGDASVPLHQACGRLAAQASVDRLIAVGGAPAAALIDAAVAEGLPAAHTALFADSATAAPAVAALLADHDLVLVKGSRGTRTDVIVDRLREVA